MHVSHVILTEPYNELHGPRDFRRAGRPSTPWVMDDSPILRQPTNQPTAPLAKVSRVSLRAGRGFRLPTTAVFGQSVQGAASKEVADESSRVESVESIERIVPPSSS
ncbi:unnamed protein product [Jaminaea pallidilutea]